jgi:PKD repeat protein
MNYLIKKILPLICLTLFLIQVKGQTTLVFPKDNSYLPYDTVTFAWNPISSAQTYEIVISTNLSFSSTYYSQSNLTSNFVKLYNIPKNNYYWKIRFYDGSTNSSWSNTSIFSIYNPSSIGGCIFQLAADSVKQNSNIIDTLFNYISPSYYSFQTSASSKPLYVGNTLNNRPVIRFDGLNDYLNGTGSVGEKTKYSFFMVCRPSEFANYRWIYQNAPINTNSSFSFGGVAGTQYCFWPQGSSGTGAKYFDSLGSITQFSIISIINNNDLSSNKAIFYQNGNYNGSSSSSTLTHTLDGYKIGTYNTGSNFFKGDLAEILFFDSAISQNSRFLVENYLRFKYFPSKYVFPVNLGFDITTNKLCDTIVSVQSPIYKSYLWSNNSTGSSLAISNSGTYWVRVTDIYNNVSSDTIIVNFIGKQTFADTNLCMGDTVTYTYNRGLPYNVSWSNGNVGTVFKTSHAGIYTLTLLDPIDGCTFQTHFTVSIDSFPIRNLVNSDTTICSGNRIQLFPISGNYQVIWTPGNDTTKYKTIYNSDVYKITATNSRNCIIRDSVNIHIQGTAPNPMFQWSRLCNRDTISFTDLSFPADSISTWQWVFNNGYSSTLKNTTTVFDTSGNYSVNLRVSAHNGCAKDTLVFIHVNKKPTVGFSHLNVCSLVPAPFTNLSDLNIGYTVDYVKWFIESNLVSTEINPNLSFALAQNYNVSLKVQTTDFCSDSMSKIVSVPNSYPAPTLFTCIAPQNNIVIGNSAVNFRWNASQNTESYKIEVSKNDVFSPNYISQTILFSDFPQATLNLDTGTYFWRIIALNPCLDSVTSTTCSFTILSPTSVNPSLWFSADTGVVISNGKISQWKDLSIHANHANQATTIDQPILSLSSATINNKPVINFDGVNDNFIVSNQTKIGSMYVVANWGTSVTIFPSYNTLIGSYITHAKPYILMGSQNSSVFNTNITDVPFANNFKINNVSSISFAPLNNFKIIEGITTANSVIYPSIQIASVYSTAGRYWNGNIAEIIAFDTVLSINERKNIFDYLNNKYAPNVSLGYDVNIQFKLCDTALIGANKTWFTKWIWSTGDTTSILRVNKSGTYWVQATNIFGILSSDTIVVNYQGQQTFADTTICLGDTVTYTYNRGLPFNVSWSNGNVGTVFKTSHAGTYTLTLIDPIDGCTFQTHFTVSIDSFPIRNLVNSDTTLCSGNRIQLFPISGNYHIIWTPGNDTTNYKTIYNPDVYRILATNSRNCIIRDSVNIHIQGTAPSPMFQWSHLCNRDTILFTDLSYPSDSISTWQWIFNNGYSSNIKNTSTVFDTTGNYSVKLRVSSHNGCAKDTLVFIHVNKKPTVDFSHLNVCSLIPTPFTNLSDLNIGYTVDSVKWFIESNLVSTEVNPNLSFALVQNYNVSLKVETTEFCSDSISKIVNISNSYPAPTLFTCIAPQNNQVIANSSVHFSWNTSQNTQFYKLEVSKSDLFNPNYISQTILFSDFPSTTLNLDTGTYFWRVLALNPCLDSVVSTIRSFSILSPIYANPSLWFSADSGVVISNGKISQWKDLSIYANHANQATTTDQPILSLSSATINNKPVINFDGVNDNFIISNQAKIGSMYVVANWGTSATIFPSYNTLIGSYITHAKPFILMGSQNSSVFNTNITDVPFASNLKINNVSSISFAPLNNFKIIEGEATGNSVIYPSIQFGSVYSTSGRYWNGNIAEIIAFDTVLSITERKNVFDYLNNKYAPNVSLGYDINIPYKLCDTALIGANKTWFTNWIWNTGDTTSIIRVNKSGIYWVQATNIFGIQSFDTIVVKYQGQRTFADTTLCLGDSLRYSWEPLQNYTLGWSNGNSGSLFIESQAGRYFALLTDTLGCSYRDTFNLYLDSLSAKFTLGIDTALCTGNPLTFRLENYALGSATYIWNSGETTPVISVTTAGNYWLNITNQRGCVGRDTVALTIRGTAPTAAFTAPGKCLGEVTLLNNLSYSQDTSSLVQWLWNFGDTTNSTLQNPTHQYSNPGIYPITLTITTTSLCSSTISNSTVIYTIPVSNFSPALGCDNIPLQFNDQTTNNYPITQWNWIFGDTQSGTTNLSSLQNPTHQFDTTGFYQVMLVSRSFFGCKDSIVKTIEIRKAPIANFEYSNTCFGQTTWLSDSSVFDVWNPITQRWWIINENEVQEPSTSFRFDGVGNYPIIYIIKSLNGCIDTIQKSVTVYANPVANFVADSVCLNQPIILQSSSTVENDIISNHRWSINNVLAGTTSPITLLIDSANTYNINLIETTAHQCRDTITKTLVVKPVPHAQFSYNYDEHNIGYQVQFANTTIGGFDYQWFNESVLFSSITQPEYDFTAEGEYSILLIATNQQGCSDSASSTILISKPIMDIALTNLSINPIGNYRQASVNIMNMSNRNITDLWLNLKLNQQATRENWTGVLRPGEIVSYTFQTQMLIPSNEILIYGCAEVESPLFSEETNLVNNQTCISLTNEFSIVSVYPNPANKELNVVLTAPYNNNITIKISTSAGKVVKQVDNISILKGITQFKISVDEISSGIYLFEAIYNDKIERIKIAVAK